ncbi:MauE/DoxX family redox-associated membrane protein [Micrococcus endophyticus]|uniref:MauE/DoxX family redox-associated membrane protein n=1 Tax=Micrococcus endophyticus TaxID=455343 RepID=UPI00382EDCDE
MSALWAVALIMLLSGTAKLRSGEDVQATFTRLRVPRPFAAPALARAFPWLELLLATAAFLAGRESVPAAPAADPAGAASQALGLHSFPTAVLLGTDRITAGGPVGGADDVLAFLEEIREIMTTELPAATDGSAATPEVRA